MRRAPFTLSAAFVALSSTPCFPAEVGAPALAHLEIVDGKTKIDHAVFLSPDGEGALDVEGPVPALTQMKLRLIRARDNQVELAFEVKHIGADKFSFSARGEVTPPPFGKKVLIAHVPEGSTSVDLYLTLQPAR
jgi:hypothetical protein